jgi:uncharacterized membrane-anchored protein
MNSASRYFWPLLIFVALVQTAALFKIVYDKDSLLKSGREITLPVKPVDPRDIFRGDYVTLGYDISSLNASQVPGPSRRSRLNSRRTCRRPMSS